MKGERHRPLVGLHIDICTMFMKPNILSDNTNRCSNIENTPMKTSVEYILLLVYLSPNLI